MPPKKATAKKGEAAAVEETKGDQEIRGPTNTCEFKIKMEVKHEDGHYIKVKYDWINVAMNGETKEVTFPIVDTGFFKDWNLLQIEGEEPIQQEEVDAKAKDGAKKKAAGAPVKAAGSKLEDINDVRPRTINYERDCAAEGATVEFTEDVAIQMSEAVLNLQIFETNKENNEETLVETVKLDISCLLFQ